MPIGRVEIHTVSSGSSGIILDGSGQREAFGMETERGTAAAGEEIKDPRCAIRAKRMSLSLTTFATTFNRPLPGR